MFQTFYELEDLTLLSKLEQVERLKNGLVAKAQGGSFDGGDPAYRTLLQALRQDPSVDAKLPTFIRSCTVLGQFWGFIQTTFAAYKQRREVLWEQFGPAIAYLETNERNPGIVPVSETLAQFNTESVHAVWQKALDHVSLTQKELSQLHAHRSGRSPA